MLLDVCHIPSAPENIELYLMSSAVSLCIYLAIYLPICVGASGFNAFWDSPGMRIGDPMMVHGAVHAN